MFLWVWEGDVYLYFCLQNNVRVTRVFQLEDTTKLVFTKFSDFEHFQVGGSCAEIEFLDDDVVCDDGRHRCL